MSVTNALAHDVKRGGVGKFYSINEIAELLDLSSRTVRRAIERKELIAHKLGRAVRIAEGDLKAFIARHRCP